MQRIAMVTRVRPDKLEDYRRLHSDPWPGVLETLRANGIGNYSIFLRGDLLFGYFEYSGDDIDASMAVVAADPVTQEWWTRTDPCQDPLAGTPEGEQWAPMESVFLMP